MHAAQPDPAESFTPPAGEPTAAGASQQRLLRLRNRLLSSPRFQRWAAAFPLTRPIARRRAQALFDLCSGFVYSQVLLACVRLKLLQRLAARSASVEELAKEFAITQDRMLRLLNAAVAIGLVEREWRGAQFSLGRHGAALLGNPGLLPMIEHNALLYEDLRDPVALLRGAHAPTQLSHFWAYTSVGPNSHTSEQAAKYTKLMASSQALIAESVVQAYSFARHQHLLDVGGGDGAFAERVAMQAASLNVTVFDLPAVAARAAERCAAPHLRSRIKVAAGDFLQDPLPCGVDAVSLVRVLHDHDDAAAARLLSAIHRVLPVGGALVVAEPMSGTVQGAAVADAYFGFYLMAMGSGRARTAAELAQLLSDAGFDPPRLYATRMPALVQVLAAHKTAD